jgi:hypothetical protein
MEEERRASREIDTAQQQGSDSGHVNVDLGLLMYPQIKYLEVERA